MNLGRFGPLFSTTRIPALLKTFFSADIVLFLKKTGWSSKKCYYLYDSFFFFCCFYYDQRPAKLVNFRELNGQKRLPEGQTLSDHMRFKRQNNIDLITFS